jgi:hypothetical protein
MKKKQQKRQSVAFTYRMLKEDHEAIREYCWHGRISIQHFIHGAVRNHMRKHGIKVPT